MNKKVISRTDIKTSPLERTTPRSSVRHRFTLERPKIRSSAGCTLPEFSADDQNAERRKFTLECPNCRSSGKATTKTRLSVKSPLERRDQNLGKNSKF